MFSSYIVLTSYAHSVLCNLFWWQAFRTYDCIYYLHICVSSMHSNIPWAGHLHFILHSLYVLQIGLASVCIQSNTVWPLFSCALQLFYCFFIRESFSFAFHMHTALQEKQTNKQNPSVSHCDWLSVLSVFYAGKFFGLRNYLKDVHSTLWIRELNSCDYTSSIQEIFKLLM